MSFSFPNNVVMLLLDDDEGNLFELRDTGSRRIWSQFEEGVIFKKGRKVD